jgi:hypothetical protein
VVLLRKSNPQNYNLQTAVVRGVISGGSTMGTFSKMGLSIGIGVLVSAIGIVILGYLAAVAIPKEYFFWFQENLNLPIGFALLDIVQQSISFGVLLFSAGYLITKKLSLSPTVTAACLLTGFWLYAVVGSPLVYNVPISNPIPELNQSVLAGLFIPILFLALGVGLGRYNNAMHATSA